jgi:hypothetical protein
MQTNNKEQQISHTHVLDAGKIECLKVVNNIKTIAMNNYDMGNNAIIALASTSVSVAASGQLSNISILKKLFADVITGKLGYLQNPKSLSDL